MGTPEKPKTPISMLLKRLADQPKGTRCTLVADPDRLVDWARPTVTDAAGRDWRRLVYIGDDLAFRQEYRRRLVRPEPLLIVLSRPVDDQATISATHIGDLLATVEGDPIDLSLIGFFRSLFPRVTPPLDTLKEFKDIFLSNTEGILKAYGQFKIRWGEPDSWSRGQLLAILLMAQCPGLTLDEIWCNQSEEKAFLTQVVGLMLSPKLKPEGMELLKRVAREATPLDDLAQCAPWLSLDRSELAGYLVLRDLMKRQELNNPATLLAGKVNFSVHPERLEHHASDVLVYLQREFDRWEGLEQTAVPFLNPGRIARVLELVQWTPESVLKMLRANTTHPAVIRQVLIETLGKTFRRQWICSWAGELRQHPLLKTENVPGPRMAAAALLHCLVDIAQTEETLAEKLPKLLSPEALLEWYVARGVHLLELRVADAYARLEAAEEPELLKEGEKYLLAGSNSLKRRVRVFLDRLDGMLADFVRSDPRKFAYLPCSCLRMIENTIGKHRHGFKRVWVLLFDGMRYDTWDAVIRPLLLEHFEVVGGQERPYFAVLPSKTDTARRALFAGRLSDQWKNYFNKPTRDEKILAARALGIPSNLVDQQVRFIQDAETTKARQRMGFTDKDALPVNILIYPISDDLGHYHSDTLTSLNQKILQQLRTQQGMRGIVDDLRQRIGPEALVLVASDHGFTELSSDRSNYISRLDAQQSGTTLEESVAYRYLSNLPMPRTKDFGPIVSVDWDEYTPQGQKKRRAFTLAVGSSWFQREDGKPATYAHGGVSLAEMVVPGVLLQRIIDREARAEILELPEVLEAREDEQCEMSFILQNTGNIDLEFELSVESNLGENVLAVSGRLATGKRRTLQVSFIPRYVVDANREVVGEETTRYLTVGLRHTDAHRRMREVSGGRQIVHVSVKPKRTKISTDALKGFDSVS